VSLWQVMKGKDLHSASLRDGGENKHSRCFNSGGDTQGAVQVATKRGKGTEVELCTVQGNSLKKVSGRIFTL